MSKTKFVTRGVIPTALLALLVLTSACSDRQPSLEQKSDFARRTDSELFLRADGAKELRREVEYWPGSKLLKRVTVFYSAGGKQISVYRENGTVKLLTEWYPDASLTVAPPVDTSAAPTLPSLPISTAPFIPGPGAIAAPQAVPATTANPAAVSQDDTAADTNKTAPAIVGAQEPKDALGTPGSTKVYDPPEKFGRVKRTIEYGEDGKTVVKASFYREDGSMAAYGRTLADSSFEQLEYTPDGKTLARQEMYTTAGDVFYMRILVGTPTNTFTRKVGNFDQVTTFGDNGVRVKRSTLTSYDGQEDVEFFKPDGKSLKYIVNRQYTIGALYFKDDGTVDYYRAFSYDGSVTVTKFRDGTARTVKDAKVLYKQTFRVGPKDANGNITQLLSYVEEFGEDGKLTRKLSISGTTNKLERVDYFEKGGDRIAKRVSIREDGTVEKIESYAWPPSGTGEATITATDVAQSQGVRESVEGATLKLAPYEDVRPLVGNPIPQSYYGYEGWID